MFYILNNLNFGDADIYFARKGFKYIEATKATKSLESKIVIGTQFKYGFKDLNGADISIYFIERKNIINSVQYLIKDENELASILIDAKRHKFVFVNSVSGHEDTTVSTYSYSNNKLSIVKYYVMNQLLYLLILERTDTKKVSS